MSEKPKFGYNSRVKVHWPESALYHDKQGNVMDVNTHGDNSRQIFFDHIEGRDTNMVWIETKRLRRGGAKPKNIEVTGISLSDLFA